MKKYIKKIICVAFVFCFMASSVLYADDNYYINNNYYGNQTTYNPYNPYNQNNSYNNVNSQATYYISGYDRVCDMFYNGEAMMTRLPVIAGTDPYMCYIANGLIKPAYLSIESWCNTNLTSSNLQGFFLNSAYIESQTSTRIVLIINCALKKKGVLDGYVEFRCYLDLTNNRYNWVKVGSSNKSRLKYEDEDWYFYP